MGLRQRLDKLEALVPSREDCPVCNAPPPEPAKVSEGFQATSEHTLDLTCELCGGPRRIIVSVWEKV